MDPSAFAEQMRLLLETSRLDPSSSINNNNTDFDMSSMVTDPAAAAMMLQMLNMGTHAEQGPPKVYAAKLQPSHMVRANFMEGYRRAQTAPKMFQTTKPFIEHGVAPLLDTLRPTTLKVVAKRVNFIHNEKVLFVKTIHKAYTELGTNVLVEDDNGDCMVLSLYNFISSSQTCDEVLPVGTKLALLAPYMKNMKDSPKLPLMLRCDNPQCVVRYETDAAWEAAKNGRPAPVEKVEPATLKELGNKAFIKKNRDAAFRYYSRALVGGSVSLQDKIACLSNRAEVSLQQQKWEQAESDARAALDLIQGPSDLQTKTMHRLAKACSRIGKVDEALALTKKLISSGAAVDQFKAPINDLLAECERLLEEQSGNYNLEQMRKDRADQKLDVFHADFVSPKAAIGVEIALAGGGSYRGCKAVQDIGENEMICASKALVYVKVDDGGKEGSLIEMDLQTKRMSTACQVRCVTNAVNLMHCRPAMGHKFYRLSPGPDFDTLSPDNNEKIDIPRIRSILRTNEFGAYGDSANATIIWEAWKKRQELGRPLSQAEHDAIYKKMSSGSGLWMNESMFNHSCAPNCTWSQIGDHLFVRSARAISAGEELCITYLPHTDTYEGRVRKFDGWVGNQSGFVCQCKWCDAMRSDPELKTMTTSVEQAFQRGAEAITTQGMPMWQASEMFLPKRQRLELLSKFKTYPLHIQHNAGMNLCIMQGAYLSHTGNFTGALSMYETAANIAYAVRGNAGMDRAQDLWRIVGAALKCGIKAKAWEALSMVWKQPDFVAFSSKDDAEHAFLDLTMKYSMPWYVDSYNPHAEEELVRLGWEVIKGKKKPTLSGGKNRKKKNGGR